MSVEANIWKKDKKKSHSKNYIENRVELSNIIGKTISGYYTTLKYNSFHYIFLWVAAMKLNPQKGLPKNMFSSSIYIYLYLYLYHQSLNS